MVDAFSSQMANPSVYEIMPFEDRLAMIVDAECDKRKANKFARLSKDAKLRYPDACPEGFDFRDDRQLDRTQIARLMECRFIDEGRDVIITGVTGTGKTWLSCAIGKAACRRFKTVRYVRLPQMLADMAVAREALRFERILAKYMHYNLLIIDDWLLFKCSKDEQRDIYELIEVRDQIGSTVFCSQFAEESWLSRLGKAPSSEGVVARITKADVVRVEFSSNADMRKHKHSLLASESEDEK
jgi:DNA replication protein DnaC